MAAQASFTLTDAESTPVARSFAPRGFDRNGVAIWNYVAGGVVAGYNQVSQLFKRPTPGSDVAKVQYQLAYPVLETVSSTGTSAGYTAAPKVAYTLRARVEYDIPARASLQERKNLRSMTAELCTKTVVVASVEDLDPAY